MGGHTTGCLLHAWMMLSGLLLLLSEVCLVLHCLLRCHLVRSHIIRAWDGCLALRQCAGILDLGVGLLRGVHSGFAVEAVLVAAGGLWSIQAGLF